jgi:hypothetical protein
MLALVTLCRRVPFDDGRWFVIITGAAFWIQALMTAYRRCEGWAFSRYCDSWGMLLIIQFSCLYFLRDSPGARRPSLAYLLAALWLSACIYGALDRAVNLLPRQLMDNRSMQMEMEYNLREYLMTGHAAFLDARIPYPNPKVLQQILSSDSIRRVLPPNLMDWNPPLSPFRQKSSGEGFLPNGYDPAVAALDKPVLGSYGKKGAGSEGAISLDFHVPPGLRQVNIQVAGYPGANGIDLRVKENHGENRGASYSIAPPMDSGDQWQTVSFYISGKSTSFKLSAKDRSAAAWLAFSMPTLSAAHLPGRWARSLANNSIHILDAGFVLLALGAVGGIKEPRGAGPMRPTGLM